VFLGSSTMIIHKLLYRYFKYYDDELFYITQAKDSIAWLEKQGVFLTSKTEVLDLGCGHGIFGDELMKKGCKVTFADEHNYLWPKLKSSTYISINLDRDDYARLGQYDLVICSNVFEHLAKQDYFIAQCSQLLKPNGKLYLSWTNWFSPFGGHDFAPFHYFGARFGRWIHYKLKGKWSAHVPGAGLYVTHIGSTLKKIHKSSSLHVDKMAARYYSEFSFLLKIPIIREFVAWNCALLISKK
jgi:SAM-dependent methyltransferase